MSLDKAVEAIIRESQERGDFDNLPGKGKPIDLEAYFTTPEEVRSAYAILKNAGMVPAEIELLQDIAALKERLTGTVEEKKREEIQKTIREKQLQFNILMDRLKRQRRER
jgi:predicted nuclease with TOPRIM domain